MLESLLKKVAGLEACKSIKRRTAFYEQIFKKGFFYRTPLVAASGIETFF